MGNGEAAVTIKMKTRTATTTTTTKQKRKGQHKSQTFMVCCQIPNNVLSAIMARKMTGSYENYSFLLQQSCVPKLPVSGQSTTTIVEAPTLF